MNSLKKVWSKLVVIYVWMSIPSIYMTILYLMGFFQGFLSYVTMGVMMMTLLGAFGFSTVVNSITSDYNAALRDVGKEDEQI